MPVGLIYQPGFNAGAWSPRMFGRTDIDRYKYAVKRLENFTILPQGPVQRRSATRYVDTLPSEFVLVPFERDDDTNYTLAWYLGKCRVYKDEAVVLAPTKTFVDANVNTGTERITITAHRYVDEQGPFRLTTTGTLPAGLSLATDYYIRYVDANTIELSLTAGGAAVNITGAAGGGTHTIAPNGTVPHEFTHSYTLAELKLLQYAQSVDVLYLAQQGHPPAQLERFADQNWVLSDISFKDGPYTELNKTDTTFTYASPNVTASSVTGVNGGLGFQNPQDVGRHIWIQEPGIPANVGWMTINSVGSTTAVNVTVQEGTISTGAQTSWRMGAFYTDNYPAVVTLVGNRLVFANTPSEPESFWMSRTGDFTRFGPTTIGDEGQKDGEGQVRADTAISATLAVSSNVQTVRWMRGLDSLLAGTADGVAEILASTQREGLTPTNTHADLSSKDGCSEALPVIAQDSVLYVGRSSKRIFRSKFGGESSGVVTDEPSLRSDHLLCAGVDHLDFARDPYPTVNAICSGGKLSALALFGSEDVLGWSQHIVGGSFGSGIAQVLDAAVIPAPGLDHSQLWLAVKRTINGATVYHLEFMEELFDAASGDLLRDALMVDCGITLDSPFTITGITAANPPVVTTSATHGFADGQRVTIEGVVGMGDANDQWIARNPTGTTFELYIDPDNTAQDGSAWDAYSSGGEVRARVTSVSGADHLEAETVDVVADGTYRGTFTVASGAVTFGEPAAAVVHLGLHYDSDLVTLRPDYGGEFQAAFKQKRVPKVYARLIESSGGRAGEEGNTLDPILRRSIEEPMGDPTALFTGDVELPVEMRWGTAAHIHIKQNLPLPFTVSALGLDVSQDER